MLSHPRECCVAPNPRLVARSCAAAAALTTALSARAAEPRSSAPPASAAPPSAEAPSGADAAPRAPRDDAWDAWGEARARYLVMSQVVEDDAGSPLAPERWAMSRLVAGTRVEVTESLGLDLELEALSGRAAGDTTALGTSFGERPFPMARDDAGDLERVLPRKAVVRLRTGIGQFSLGAQTLTWGTGMLANDGAGDPAFGDPWMGNVLARVGFGTRPLQESATRPFLRSLTVFVAGGWVLRDDNASLYEGDRALAGVAGVRAEHSGDALGVLFVARHQRDRAEALRPGGERAETTAFVTDAHGKLTLPTTDASRLSLEAETAVVVGRSTRPWSDATWRDGSRIFQLGAISRVRWDDDASHLTALLEGGYASGDNDPRDRVSRTFTMHTDHNVGLVLFDQVLPLLSARGVDRLDDPTLVATPPPGTRYAVNPGSVQNALYLHPVVKLRPLPPLDLRLGYLYATPAADVLDAYQTGINAGFVTSYGGRTQNRKAYGHEVDARATWDLALPGALVVRAGAEGGVLLPGGAFDGVAALERDGGGKKPVWLGRALLSVLW
ncbi:MAG: hypothetical protein IT376_12735 [Polyangiaceae bacterium]|nr:hypothetical protein [Polyangiaceae bacterium]